jgi:hypothetical protein
MLPNMGALADDDAGALAMLEQAPAHKWPEWVRVEDAPLGNWVAGFVGHERARCAAAALAVIRFIAPRLPPDAEDVVTTHASIEERIAAIELWRAEKSETAQSLALSAFDHTRQTRAWRWPGVIDRVDAWIEEAADFAVHTVWSGALPGPFEPPRPHLCAGLAAICARRALLNDGVHGQQSALLVARTVAVEMFSDVSLASARVAGKKLYLRRNRAGPEEVRDWTGPEGAHYARIEMSSSTHVYTTRWEWKTWVYDAAGTLLGELTDERWD